MLRPGSYRYALRQSGTVAALEEAHFDGTTVSASRQAADGQSRHKLTAQLEGEGRVGRVSVSYSSALFTRKAAYEAAGESLRGSVSALAGRNEIVVPLGRFHEIDVAEFVIFRALLLDHVRRRGQARWTGRVAVIDASTLVAASLKQNCLQRDGAGLIWSYEPRMGDAEEIELNESGAIVRRRDNRGRLTELLSS